MLTQKYNSKQLKKRKELIQKVEQSYTLTVKPNHPANTLEDWIKLMNEIDLEIDEMDLIRSQKENRKYTGEQYMLHSIEEESNEEDGEDGECKEEVMDNLNKKLTMYKEPEEADQNQGNKQLLQEVVVENILGDYLRRELAN